MTKIVNNGGSFESFLEEEGIFEEVEAAAVKRVIAWQMERELAARKFNKSALARRMKTSRTQVDRLLDPGNTSVTLHTLFKAAAVLGKRLRVEIAPAVRRQYAAAKATEMMPKARPTRMAAVKRAAKR